MSDPLKNVAAGQVSPFLKNSRTVNAALEALRGLASRRRGETGGSPFDDPLSGSLHTNVKYMGSSVTTLASFSVLAYSTPIADPADDDRRHGAQREPAFEGATPSNASQPFVVTIEPIKGQKIGRAVVSGLAVVQVEITSAAHTRAKPIAGSTSKLTSCASGGVPIVWSESGTGTKWAIVLLDFGETEASDPACKSFLSLPECATLEVVEAYGACACITTGQTASLTRSGAALASDDLLYGCPPGVTTATNCAGGSAPRKYSFTLAGLTGACSVMNGGWTIAYTTGNTWVGTKGGYTATLTFSGSGADGTLTFTDATDTEVLVYTIENANCCSTITTFERDMWTCDDPPASVTLIPATACGAGASYTPIFDHDTTGNIRRPRFRLRPTAGSGAADILFGDGVCGIDGNGKPYIEFSTSDAKFCTGDAEACGDHKVTFRLTCTACANVDYTGPGWYCTGLGTCQQFTSDPGDGVELVDGPFATAGECSCSIAIPCCEDEVSKLICLAFGRGVEGSSVDNLLGGTKVMLRGGLSGWTGSNAFGTFLLTPCNAPEGGLDANYYYWRLTFTWIGIGSTTLITRSYIPAGLVADAPLDCGSFFPLTGTYGDDDPGFFCTGCTGLGGWEAGNVPFTISQVDSTADCPAVTYNCVPGFGCVAVYDGSGRYATEAECLADSCEGGGGTGGGDGTDDCCGIVGGASVRLVIVGGADAGTYDTIWYESSGFLYADFKGGEYRMACGVTGPGSLSLSNFPPGHTAFGNATSFACGPFSATFPLAVGPSGTTSISAVEI